MHTQKRSSHATCITLLRTTNWNDAIQWKITELRCSEPNEWILWIWAQIYEMQQSINLRWCSKFKNTSLFPFCCCCFVSSVFVIVVVGRFIWTNHYLYSHRCIRWHRILCLNIYNFKFAMNWNESTLYIVYVRSVFEFMVHCALCMMNVKQFMQQHISDLDWMLQTTNSTNNGQATL